MSKTVSFPLRIYQRTIGRLEQLERERDQLQLAIDQIWGATTPVNGPPYESPDQVVRHVIKEHGALRAVCREVMVLCQDGFVSYSLITKEWLYETAEMARKALHLKEPTEEEMKAIFEREEPDANQLREEDRGGVGEAE